MSININTLVSNFEKLKRGKYVEIKESDIEAIPFTKPGTKAEVSLCNEIIKRNNEILEMINTVNGLKSFDIDFRMFDILLHRMNLSTLNIDFYKNSKGQYESIGFWLIDEPKSINETLIMDGKNAYECIRTIGRGKDTLDFYYPKENVAKAFLKEFDDIYKTFCDYLEALSNGDKFVERYYKNYSHEKLWRVEASTGNKIYYNDTTISSTPLRTTI